MEKFGNQFVVYPYRLTKKSETRIDEYEQVHCQNLNIGRGGHDAAGDECPADADAGAMP